MFNRRKIKTYKFKSAIIEIYRIGKFRITERKCTPDNYFMKIVYNNYRIINSAYSPEGLTFLKGYALKHAKNELRRKIHDL